MRCRVIETDLRLPARRDPLRAGSGDAEHAPAGATAQAATAAAIRTSPSDSGRCITCITSWVTRSTMPRPCASACPNSSSRSAYIATVPPATTWPAITTCAPRFRSCGCRSKAPNTPSGERRSMPKKAERSAAPSSASSSAWRASSVACLVVRFAPASFLRGRAWPRAVRRRPGDAPRFPAPHRHAPTSLASSAGSAPAARIAGPRTRGDEVVDRTGHPRRAGSTAPARRGHGRPSNA